jgi:hypothetical protein
MTGRSLSFKRGDQVIETALQQFAVNRYFITGPNNSVR